MKPILISCLILSGLFSCSKEIKKRDLKGRWNIHYSESMDRSVYQNGTEEHSYYLLDNNIGVFSYESTDNYEFTDTVYYVQNYFQLNNDYTFEQVSEGFRLDDNGMPARFVIISSGDWYFLSSSDYTNYQENERICFSLKKTRETYYSPELEEYVVERLYEEHSRYFFWTIADISKNEIRIESESNYVHDHNQHTDVEGFERSILILKK